MGKSILGHFILVPYLFGFVPELTIAVLNSFWVGLAISFAFWVFGPVAAGRKRFLTNPNLTKFDHLRLLSLILLSILVGSASGRALFFSLPPEVY